MIFLGMPTFDGKMAMQTAKAFYVEATAKHQTYCMTQSTSALGQCFNLLWAFALGNAKRKAVTHFAMLHADVSPEPYWLDILLDEMERMEADVVSVCLPIKNAKSFTSTSTGNPDDPWDYKRITMTELDALPDTFDIDDVPHEPGHILLVNTGCWVCDLRRKWWYEKHPNGELKFCFTMRDRITELPDGKYHIEFAPEDWAFSRECHRAGARVVATKKVKAVHWGQHGYPNSGVWGTRSTDNEMREMYEQIAQGQVNDSAERTAVS